MHLLAGYQPTQSCVGSGERVNVVSKGCSATFDKIIRKTVAMEYFLSKLADVQLEASVLERDSTMRETFQNSLSKTSVWLLLFRMLCKTCY